MSYLQDIIEKDFSDTDIERIKQEAIKNAMDQSIQLLGAHLVPIFKEKIESLVLHEAKVEIQQKAEELVKEYKDRAIKAALRRMDDEADDWNL